MNRRQVIGVLASAAASPSRVRAEGSIKRLGLVIGWSERDAEVQARLRAFLLRLSALGWDEGRNLKLEYAFGNGDPQLLNRVAATVVATQPDLILAAPTIATRVVQKASREIPIVFVMVSDPVGDGFVANLARPEANLTGFINFEAAMGGKWVQLLKEVAPATRTVALLYNPTTTPGAQGAYFNPAFAAAAGLLGLEPRFLTVHTQDEIEAQLNRLADEAHTALVAASDSYLVVHRGTIIANALRRRLPAMYPGGYFARDGGLIGYAPDNLDLFDRAAGYVDRVFRGSPVTELPVQIPAKFELVVNLATAKNIGIEMPPAILARADEVIE